MVDVQMNKTLISVSIVALIIIILVILIIMLVGGTRSSCKILNPPSSITVTTDSDIKHTMIITWSSVPNATTYGVYIRSVPSISKQVYERKIFTTETSVIVNNLYKPEQFIRISSINKCGESELTSQKSAIIECKSDPPKNINASIINANTAQVSWDSVLKSQGYHLYVNGEKVYSGTIPTVSFDTPVPGDYEIQVSTQNMCGEGPKSPILIYTAPILYI